jgi:hypothetical protein
MMRMYTWLKRLDILSFGDDQAEEGRKKNTTMN